MDRFVVEADKKVVGVAVRVPGGFRFIASDPEFRSADRRVFRRARTLASSIAQLARARRAENVADALH